MTTKNVVETNDLGIEFDVGVIEPQKIHVKIDNTTIVKDISGVLSAPQSFAISSLPPPKIKLLSGATSGFGEDGNVIPIIGLIQITIEGMPNEFLTNPAYNLGLELCRRKARARAHNQRNVRNSIVHPAHVDGTVMPVLIGGTKGIANGIASTYRPTEWLLSGMPHNGVVVIKPDAITGWFKTAIVLYRPGPASAGYYRYLDGRSMSQAGWWTLNNINGFSAYNTSGVFYFRYSVYDAKTSRRIYGPYSEQIIVRQENPVSTSSWTAGAAPYTQHKVINPNFINKGAGSLIMRLGHVGDSLL